MILTCSWAPDGSYLATVNGENSGICVAPVISRCDWSSSICLVGHEAPIEVAVFNPNVFNVKDEATGLLKETCVCALGSQDNGLSVWWTGAHRAIVSIQNLFTHSVLDMAWTIDGLGLYACSYDGTIAYLQFDQNDFGQRISLADTSSKLLQYGSVARLVVPESVEILELENRLVSEKKDALVDRMDDGHFDVEEGFGRSHTLQNSKSSPMKIPSPVKVQTRLTASLQSGDQGVSTLKAQSVTTDKQGKKRIRPVLVHQNIPLIESPSKIANQRSGDASKRPKTVSGAANHDHIEPTVYTLPVIEPLKDHNLLSIPSVRSVFSVQATRASQRTDILEVKNTANGEWDFS